MRIALDCCAIRHWLPSDRDSLVRYANNRKVWRNLTDAFPSPYTEARADTWLAPAGERQAGIHFAIAVDDTAVGGIGVIPLSGIYRKTAEFGYWLGEPYWGRGIATAAARRVIEHTFATLPLERLQLIDRVIYALLRQAPEHLCGAPR